MFATNYELGFLLVHIITSIAEQPSTTTSYMNPDDFWRNFKSKYHYYLTPRSHENELQSQSSLSRGDFDHYEGYQAQWPSHKVVAQPIHVHHTEPYHKEKDNHNNYILPLLLLALLPFILGALVLLPLLFTFITSVLQLLALLQQTVQNNTTGTNVGGRRRRNIHGVNPILATTVLSLVENLSLALEKYSDKTSNF